MIKSPFLFLVFCTLFSCAPHHNSYQIGHDQKGDELIGDEIETFELIATVTNIEMNSYLSGIQYLITVEFENINNFGQSSPSKSNLNFMLDLGKKNRLKVGDKIKINSKVFKR